MTYRLTADCSTTELLRIYNKSRHRAIFPKDYSFSIFAAITFNNHVRDGMVWYYYAIDTEIKSIKN